MFGPTEHHRRNCRHDVLGLLRIYVRVSLSDGRKTRLMRRQRIVVFQTTKHFRIEVERTLRKIFDRTAFCRALASVHQVLMHGKRRSDAG